MPLKEIKDVCMWRKYFDGLLKELKTFWMNEQYVNKKIEKMKQLSEYYQTCKTSIGCHSNNTCGLYNHPRKCTYTYDSEKERWISRNRNKIFTIDLKFNSLTGYSIDISQVWFRKNKNSIYNCMPSIISYDSIDDYIKRIDDLYIKVKGELE